MKSNNNFFNLQNLGQDTYGYVELPEVTKELPFEDWLMRTYKITREEAKAAAFQANLNYIAKTGDTSTLPDGYAVDHIPGTRLVLTGYGDLTRIANPTSIIGPDGKVVASYDPIKNVNFNTLDPADNVANDLIFDIFTLGAGAASGALKTTGKAAYKLGLKGTQAFFKYTTPSTYIRPLASKLFKASPYTSRLAGLWGDNLAFSTLGGLAADNFIRNPNLETGAYATLGLSPYVSMMYRPFINSKFVQGVKNLKLELPNSLYTKYVLNPQQVAATKPTSGYMIKPLFEGNKLEMQMGKDGDISVKAILNYMKTLSLSDLAILLKALNTFGNLNKISYFAFKLAVLDQIPLFTRIPHEGYSTYGMSRLNLAMRSGEQLLGGGIRIRTKHTYTAKPETYTFEDLRHLYPYSMYEGRINAHYPGEPLGHSRTYTTVEDPNILHVMESLSDWALHLDLSSPKYFPKDHNGRYPIYEDNGNYFLDNFFASLLLLNRNILLPNTKNYVTGELFFDVLRYNPRALDSAYPKIKDPILLHMADTYTLRHIYENMRKAFESGLTIMRYPTSDTAVKIEGYTKKYPIEYDNELSDIEFKELTDKSTVSANFQSKLPREFLEPYEREVDYTDNWSQKEIEDHLRRVKLSEKWETENLDLIDLYRDLLHKISKETNDQKELLKLKYANLMKYDDKLLSILNKYEHFPKQFKKLFPSQDVRIVTDNKGNTWYEVDIPKNFMDIEWLFKSGGKINKKSKLIKKK